MIYASARGKTVRPMKNVVEGQHLVSALLLWQPVCFPLTSVTPANRSPRVHSPGFTPIGSGVPVAAVRTCFKCRMMQKWLVPVPNLGLEKAWLLLLLQPSKP